MARCVFSFCLIEMDFWSKIIPKLVNIEVFERKRIMRACARNFYLDKIHFLNLFGIIVGARAPASAPAFFGVALQLALRPLGARCSNALGQTNELYNKDCNLKNCKSSQLKIARLQIFLNQHSITISSINHLVLILLI